jgi:hypothetical protein
MQSLHLTGHFLRFFSYTLTPTIIYRDQAVSELSLEIGKYEDIVFSREVSCIGYKTEKEYVLCPRKENGVRQCQFCSLYDISRVYTVGDFSLYPDLYEEAKKQEYCLYVACFGENLFKCGVTRKDRFQERMLEQGADFGSIILVLEGPEEIYGLEKKVQAEFHLLDAVRLDQKIRNLNFNKDLAKSNFEKKLEQISNSTFFSKNSITLEKFQIYDFTSYYPKINAPIQTYNSVLGNILGAKGELLFFESIYSKRHYVINMRKKVGHFFQRKTSP